MRTTLSPNSTHGLARWVGPADAATPGHLGRLRITTTKGVRQEYDVLEERNECGRVTGYRLVVDEDTSYFVDVDWGWAQSSCTCKGYIFRGGCKHRTALPAALKAKGMVPS